MDSEYEVSDDQNYANDEAFDNFQPKKKNQTKNEQIYGDFFEAYEAQPKPSAPSMFSQQNAYDQFKPGSTMETYSSDVEVTLPISKPKSKNSKSVVEEEDEKPMLGQFTLNSFLNQLGKGGLDDIDEENEDSSDVRPEGLNEKILNHLQLVKIGQEETQEPVELEHITFEKYMQMGRPNQKTEPQYKTEQEKDKASDFKANYGVGFKMMEKMGFKNITKGLGKEETGRNTPVEANAKRAFTMKDDNRPKKNEKSQTQGQAEAEKEIVPSQQLFKYHSKNPKINNFLLDLKKDFEKLNSQIYFLQNEVQSIKNKVQIEQSTRYQEQNQTNELKDQITKLQIIGNDLERCIEYPHLGQYYQIDLLFVKKCFDKLKLNNLDWLHKNAEKELSGLRSALYKFYLAKSKESIKMFQQTSAIEQKMHMKISKKQKKKSDIIDLDNLSDDDGDDVQVVDIGVDEKDKIKKFMNFLTSKCLLPIVQNVLKRYDSLDQIKDDRVIDLIDVIRKFQNGKIVVKLVEQYLVSLFEGYLIKLNFDDFQSEKVKVLPHLVIIPWLHLLTLSQKCNFMAFYKEIARKLWNLESSVLYNIITPILKFSSNKQISFFCNLCLAPRLLYLLQNFSISNPNPAILNGFTKYSELLSKEMREEMLESTLFVQVQDVYMRYRKEKEEKEVSKWLKGWRKFSDKVCPGKFTLFFQQIVAKQ